MENPEARLRVLCTEPSNFSDRGLAEIASFADLDAEELSAAELNDRIDRYDVLVVRLRTFATADLIARAARLRAIVSPTTGVNHIDLEAAASRGVEVFHLRGESEFLRTIASTAEHTWGLLLALLRNIPAAARDVLDGNWRQDIHRGHELHGKRLGILGFGRLGSIVAGYGHAFGMQVAAYDRDSAERPDYVQTCRSLEELLSTSNILSIHLPLNESTRGTIGRAELAQLPDGAVLVNTSRGEIVDEAALIEALDAGRLGGAAVDVLTEEQSVDKNPLVEYAGSHQNVLITPHIGGATYEAIEKTDLFVIARLIDWLKSER